MSTVTIPFKGSNYSIPYTRKEKDGITSIHVIIDHIDIQKHTGFSFYITVNHTDNTLSHPITSPTDHEIKKEIVAKILEKEKIHISL